MRKLALLIACLAGFAATPVAAEDWKYDAVLYGWLSGLQGTIGVVGVTEEPVDATFDDLAGFVDFALAAHFEAKQAKSLFVTDVSYINLGSERDAMVANQPVTIDMDLTQWIVEAGGGYRATPEFDVLVVGRYYNLDLGGVSSSVAGSSTGSVSESWADIYLGGRYTKILKEKWMISLRGDIGVGGSDFAWFGNAALGYRFSDLFTLAAAYRVLSLDREGDRSDADYFLYDVTQNGLGIGLGFSF
jgi:hypothetical protein